jgi:aspartyl-tRNA(Asn)/glutamyl-tRNA(Gln) amidotransferase subunit A
VEQEHELVYLPATSVAARIRSGQLSAADLVETIFRRAERLQPSLNAFTYFRHDAALAEAKRADEAVRRGDDLGPLHGVPITVKDNVLMAGEPSTSGSRLLRDFVPDHDSVTAERLRAAGAIVVGRTNTPEFFWRGSTDNRLYGETRNPWDLTRTSGGSSGGAGAAVASGLAPLALGTDGAGSIRIPASFCGIVGLKPSFGRVPFDPPPGPAETTAHAGPMTRTVRDAALMLDVLAGPDDRDRNSLPATGERFEDEIGKPIAGWRIAWSPNLDHIPVEPEVTAIAGAAAAAFEDLGCVVETVDGELPDPAPILDVLYPGFQAGAHGRRPQSELDEMDPELVKVIEESKRLTAVEMGQAAIARARYWEAMRKLLQRYDLLLTPTISVPPFELGIVGPTTVAGRPVVHLGWTLCYPFNYTGQPAITVPCGSTADGLPVGLQIVGHRFADAAVLRAAAAFEAIRPWQHHTPPL